MLRRASAALAAATQVAILLLVTGSASAAPRQTASVRFTSTAPSSPSGVDWAMDYRNPDDPKGKPPALARSVTTFPPGSRIDTGAPVHCDASDAELMLEGPAACPAASRVGSGLLDVDTGSLSDAIFPRVLHNQVTNLSNSGESIIYTESTNMPGVQTRTVTRAKVSGRTITTDVPPLPGVPPPDRYTALKRFRLVVPALRRAGRFYVTTPPSCPRSRTWVFTLVFQYRDGVREVVRSPSSCVPRNRSRRLHLSITPTHTEAGDARRFAFVVTGPRGAGVAGAKVSLGGGEAATGPRGRATLVASFRHAGRFPARATLAGFRAAVRWVRVEGDGDR
jgi:hypothetical protein